MALFLSSHTSLLIRHPKPQLSCFSLRSPQLSLSFNFSPNPKISSLRIRSALSSDGSDSDSSEKPSPQIADEWGEKSVPEPEVPVTKLSEADPPQDEDEWGSREGEAGGYKWGSGGGEAKDGDYSAGNGSVDVAAGALYDKLGDLKRSLVDTFYGSELGFKASPEVRGEVLELVNQLESCNPTPVPTEAASLDGKWVLLYTAFSELLPLLAAGATPLLKLEKISQSINSRTLEIENSTTFSTPFASFSFSASATFEIRSPSRIQVTFKEGTLNPPSISSTISLPKNIDIFGQTLDLSLVQTSLNPLQDVVGRISRAISGQPSLKVPIPGERSSSWLLTTYLDDDFRISRGDGGLFILAKEGSPLLYR